MWLTPLEQLDLLSDYRTDHHNHNPLLLVLILSRIEPRFHRPTAPYREKHDSGMSNLPWEWNNRSKLSRLSRNLLCTSVSQGFEDFLDILPGRMQEQGSSLYFIVTESAWIISPLLSAYKQKLFNHLRHRLPTFERSPCGSNDFMLDRSSIFTEAAIIHSFENNTWSSSPIVASQSRS